MNSKINQEAEELLSQEVTELLNDELDSIVGGGGIFCNCNKNSNCKQNT